MCHNICDDYSPFNTSLSIQVYMMLFVIPEEKALMEECNYRILCQKGMINDPICQNYAYKNLEIPELNLTNLTVGTTIP